MLEGISGTEETGAEGACALPMLAELTPRRSVPHPPDTSGETTESRLRNARLP